MVVWSVKILIPIQTVSCLSELIARYWCVALSSDLGEGFVALVAQCSMCACVMWYMHAGDSGALSQRQAAGR